TRGYAGPAPGCWRSPSRSSPTSRSWGSSSTRSRRSSSAVRAPHDQTEQNMATREKDLMNTTRNRESVKEVPNGAAMAAFLAAGIGAFAVGLFVLLNETGIF